MRTRTLTALLALTLLAGCGGSDETATEPASPDAGFVRAMVPHHQSAIEMARLAEEQAEHPELRALAQDIVSTQQAEIEELEAIAGELGVEAGHGGDGGHMGMDDEAMGDPAALDGAQPFDRAFIDMMIPHHEAAVEMAQDLLESTEHPQLRELAESIAGAQQREIDQMRAWRSAWY